MSNFCGFAGVAAQRDLTSTLYLDRLNIGIQVGAGIDLGLAVEDPQSGVAGIEAVQPLLGQVSLTIRHVNQKKIFFIELIDLDIRATLNQPLLPSS